MRLFLASYDDFKARLKRCLGSEDPVCDVLHEIYLRIDRLDNILEVKKLQAYLFRIVLNIAVDRREGDARLSIGEGVAEPLQMADEGLDSERIVGGHVEIRRLLEAFCELPTRRRQILIASYLEETPHVEISRRFGISICTVEKELKAVLWLCAERLERKVIQRLGPGVGKPS